MFKQKYLFYLFILILNNSAIAETKVYIIATIDNEIITNQDVKKESDYLKILNPSLEQVNKKQNLDLAKQSLINEIVKKKEISKFINIEQENSFVDDYMNNLVTKLKYKNIIEFENDLFKKDNYTLIQVKKKIKIELLWNELIYKKYNNQVKIDKENLVIRVNKLSNKTQKEYLISEILFTKKKNEDLNNYINQIIQSIDEIGFNNTANIYSISESSKLGGKIGWINENSLSENITKNLNSIQEGEYTDIIDLGKNYLILKIEETKQSVVSIDKKIELEKLIKFETNKQLNKFSRIYFDKSKINYIIDEN